MKIEEWSHTHKQTLRDLYGDFLEESGFSIDDAINGKCPNYLEFQESLYKETIHALPSLQQAD